MIGIVTDSSADLPLSYYKDHENVVMMPLTIRLGMESLKDWYDISPEFPKSDVIYTINGFYEKMAEKRNVPYTVPVTVYDFYNVYSEMAKKCDTIISIHFSKHLGHTVEQARIAASRIKGCDIRVIDTLQISNGVGAIVKETIRLRDMSVSVEDIISTTKKMISSMNSKLIMTNDSSDYLFRCGRMSLFKYVFANILKLKNFTITDGKIQVIKKYKGKDGLNTLIQNMVNELINAKKLGKKVYVVLSHANCERDLKGVENLLKKNDIDYCVNYLGPVTGVYGGPGTWAVMPVVI